MVAYIQELVVSVGVLYLLVPAVVSSSDLYQPSCTEGLYPNRASPAVINLLKDHVRPGPALSTDRDILVSKVSCSSHPSQSAHTALCKPLLSSSNLLMELCGDDRVDSSVRHTGLCRWEPTVKWSKARWPRRLVHAVLVNDSNCVTAHGHCHRIEHRAPVLMMTNDESTGQSCNYTRSEERITVGFRCVLTLG